MRMQKTQLQIALVATSTAICQLALANDSSLETSFEATATASSNHQEREIACQQAYENARDKAFNSLEEQLRAQAHDIDYMAMLTSQSEAEQRQTSGSTTCTFTGTWRAKLDQVAKLINTQQLVNGSYRASCLDERDGDRCWYSIVDQAKDDLYRQLDERHPNTQPYRLIYRDFSGSQRDVFRDNRLEMTAEGEFQFDVIAENYATENYTNPTIQVRHPASRVKTPPREIIPYTPVRSSDENKPYDVTLSYTWDHNATAKHNDLAISSQRIGMGIWAQNRFGLAAFIGEDSVGLGNKNDHVKNDGYYDTFGLGLGYRLFDNRQFTLENMIYYVNAEQYSTTIDPDCSSCTATEFESEDYLQATTNLKTNRQGLNAGLMLTWKFLDQEDVDPLSAGLYLELQF